MKALLFTAIVFGLSFAQADILRPSNQSTETVTGARAEMIYNKISSAPINGGDVRGPNQTFVTTTYKVDRSEDGLSQVVCEKNVENSSPKAKTTVRCTKQKSLDGRELPVFNAPVRMG